MQSGRGNNQGIWNRDSLKKIYQQIGREQFLTYLHIIMTGTDKLIDTDRH